MSVESRIGARGSGSGKGRRARQEGKAGGQGRRARQEGKAGGQGRSRGKAKKGKAGGFALEGVGAVGTRWAGAAIARPAPSGAAVWHC